MTSRRPLELLANGKATVLSTLSGSKTVEIMAMVHGEAGNILRLIKPRTEALGWDGSYGIRLRSFNPCSSEDCYWLEGGDPIQQITFASDNDGPSSWLAVRKNDSTCIFKPTYHSTPTPSSVSKSLKSRYPLSRLSANPLLILKSDKTGGSPHCDISFNPWYMKQFAVVDEQGQWSVWDIEGLKKKRTTFEAVPEKSGHIHEDLLQKAEPKVLHEAEGWSRVMWAGGVSTLVVCDRHRIVVYDLKATPKLLHSPEIVDPVSTDWILDAKRSPVNLHHIFVLTNTQLFWIYIDAAGEGNDEEEPLAGARVILSSRHFRDAEDGSIRLHLFRESDGVCFPKSEHCLN